MHANAQPPQAQAAAANAQAWQPRDRQPQPVPAWQPTQQPGRVAPAPAQPQAEGVPVRRVWTQTVARVPAQEGMPVDPEAEAYTPFAPYTPAPQEGPRRRRTELRAGQTRAEDAAPMPQADAAYATPAPLPSYSNPYAQAAEPTAFDPDGWEDALPAQDADDVPETQPTPYQTAAQAYPAPAQAAYLTPASAAAQPYPTAAAPAQTAYPAPAATDLLDDDSGRYEGVLSAKLAEPVPVPTADLRLPRRKRRVWPAVLLTLTFVVGLAAALYYTGLWEQLRQATVSSPLFADIPAIFAGDQPKSATPMPALAPATQAPTVELRSASVEPAEGTAPVQLTFQVETNADASSIRLLTESGEALHIAAAYGNPKGDGVLWQITADFEAAYTGKVRFFLRDQTGTWVEGALTCDVAVR
ncbi:MAG: hypothetical protein VB104_07340 [Candidatus Limiplasma sp.]|nr:hypothetical protein [Candidatus Limiplasma sp.]